MTKKEMTELFSVMLLAWPNAEMFKGGVAKLGPTIELWTACLSLACGLAGRSDCVLHHIKLYRVGPVFSLGRIGQKIMRNLTGIAVPTASQ